MAGPEINLPSLVTRLNIDMSGLAGSQADATREGSAIGERLGDAMRRRLQVAADSLPPIRVDADTSEADRDLADLRTRMAALADRRIGVDVSIEQATREIEELQTHLGRLAVTHPDVEVTADIADALSALAQVTEAARVVDSLDPTVEVHVDEDRSAERAGRDFDRLTAAAAGAVRSLGSIVGTAGVASAAIGAIVPVIAGLVAMLAGIAPAAGIAATALLSVASAQGAFKLGTSGIGDAIKAAWAPAAAGAGAAAAGAGQAAAAQRALKQATEAAAEANQRAGRQIEDAQRAVGDATKASADAQVQAARQVASAERSLADAQRAALTAQQAVTDARRQAAQDLEDLNTRLTDGALDQRANTLRVQEAKLALDKALSDPTASELQRQQAQLTYDQALQRLAEQGRAYQRLQEQAAAATAAGVEGSARVATAQAKVADTARTVQDREQALTDARISAQDRIAQADRDLSDRRRALADAEVEQARTAARGLEQIAAAQEALGQKAGAAAGGVDKLAEAMAKLSPSARSFVEALIGLKPALDSLRLDVQETLFKGLAETVQRTAAAVLPTLHTALVASAGHLNTMAKGIASTATELAESGTLGRALASANVGLGNLTRLPSVMVQGLVQVAAAAGPAFERLTAAGGGALDRLSQKMKQAFESGAMTRAIDQAIELIGQLASVAVNIGKILGAVFNAANTSGGSFIQTLQKVTSQLAATFASPAVQAGLTALFSTMSLIATTAAPLLGDAIGIIAGVLAELGPPAQQLVRVLGDALRPTLAALGPVLVAGAQAVGSLVVAASPLLALVGQLASGLLPALVPWLQTAARLFEQAAPLVQTLANALLAGLSPILAALPGIAEPLLAALTTLTGALLPVLAQLISQLPLAELAESFAAIALALAPVLAQLAVLLADQLKILLPILTPIISAVGQLAQILAGVLASYIQNIVVPALNTISALLRGDFSGAWASAKELVRGFVTFTVDLFVQLPARLGELLVRLGSALWDGAGQAWGKFKEASIAKIRDDFLPWVANLRFEILDAVGDLGSLLKDAGRRVLTGFMDGIKSNLGPLTNLLGSITDMIPIKKGPPATDAVLLTPAGRSIMDGLLGGISSRIPSLQAQLQAITAQVAGAFAGESLALAGSPGALVGAYAGMGRPVQQQNTINLYGSSITAREISDELSWRAGMGAR